MSSEHHPDQHAGRAAVAEPVAPVGQVVEFDDYIEAQLRKTQSHVRGVDAASAVMVWAAFTLGYVLLAALFDHWIVTGGLGFWGRALFLGLYLVLVAAFLILRVLPLAVRTINPLYAAHTIERSAPSLKNTLLNFLFLRGEQGRMSPAIFQAVEQQAATNLAGAHADAAVDRSKLIKIGYVLLASLLVCAVYALASPKDLFKTVGRIAVPWADINAPTQTTVSEVEPRDTLAFRGQQIAVSARINDLPEGAKALLYYSTADGQIVDRTIEMKLGPDGYKHACLLPADEATLQQDVDYRIEAGDAITRAYHVEVIAAPTIFVEAVEYKYPAYTGLLAQRVERHGDLRGIEGTAVTLDAVANADIETAHVDFDCDGTLDQRMTVDGLRAKATFRLALANDRKSPWHSSYQLIFKNQRGQQNPQPVRQQIEVTRDIPPEIDFVSPKTDEVAVPLNGTATLEIVATDPDFALRLVKLSASKGREPLFDKLLLDEVHRGQFVGKHRIEPSKLGLKAGDVVEYTALAEDNKDAPANRTQTVTRRIRIVPPQAARDGQNQAGDDQQGGQGQQQDNQRGDGQGERRDDMPPDGDGQARGEQDEPDNQPGEAGEPGGQQGTARSPQADRGDEPAGADQRGDQAQQDQQTRGDKPNPDDRKSDQRDAEQSDGEQSDKQQGEGKQEQGQPGAGQQGKGRAGQDQQGQDQQGQSQQGRGQQGKGQKGDGQQGAGQQNEQQGEGQQGQSQQAGGESRQGAQQQPSGQGGDQRRQQDEPAPGVASDGSNDGDAIERILNHRDQQQPGEPPKPGDPLRDQREGAQSPQKQGNQANPRDQARKPGDQQAGKEPGDKQPADQPGQSDARQGQQSQPEKGAAQHGQQGDKQADKQGDQQQGGEKNPSQNDQPQQGADQDGQSERGPAEKGQQQDGQQQDGQQPDAQSQKGQSEKAQPQKGQAENGQRGQQPMPGDKPPGDKSTNNKQQGEPQADGKREPAPQEDGAEAGKPAGDAPRDEGQGQGPSKEGQGAQAKSDPMGNQSASGSDQQRKDAQGGDGEQQKGTSGAGQKSEDKQGSPSPQETAQPRDKSQQPSPNDSQGPKDQNQAQSPSQSKRESDSEGQDDGDRSGGGKRGGGQKANKSGTGGAGQNTAADEGAGASEEAGKGETSDRAGQDQAAQKPTGQSGSQQGPGSASKAGDDANRQGGDKNSPEAQGKPGESADKSQGGQSHPGGGTPRGGEPGQASDQQPAEQPYRTAPEAADEANLDYARKATDLALSHLKDELAKDQPDPDLLNKLGWTREELAQFVKRWEEMRANADAPGDTGQSARRQLDETLRSLGLRPRATNLRSNEARNDQTRGMRESRHTNAPAEYAEQTKAYTQGTARGGNGK
ncbi:MAG: hypothetical protein AB7O59_07110 [Pirellulales bacterium]